MTLIVKCPNCGATDEFVLCELCPTEQGIVSFEKTETGELIVREWGETESFYEASVDDGELGPISCKGYIDTTPEKVGELCGWKGGYADLVVEEVPDGPPETNT
jgi:hypothetical protein